jgi:hypothetical protein
MANITLAPGTGAANLVAQPAQLFILGDLTVDPNGPFFPYILTHLVASAGLTPAYDAGNYPKFMEGVMGIFPGAIGARVDLAECIRRVRTGALPQLQAEIALASMLANTTYESLAKPDRRRLKLSPVFQFFRHVRNAASHGNRWHFRSWEPISRAEWNGIVIDDTLKGPSNPLHGKQCIYGTLKPFKPGDVLFLVRDVERLL